MNSLRILDLNFEDSQVDVHEFMPRVLGAITVHLLESCNGNLVPFLVQGSLMK